MSTAKFTFSKNQGDLKINLKHFFISPKWPNHIWSIKYGKTHILIQVKPLKMVNTKCCLLILGQGWNLINGFWSNQLFFFCDQKMDSILKKSNWSLRSFSKIDGSIQLLAILFKDRQEWIDPVNILNKLKIKIYGSNLIFWHKKGGKLSKPYNNFSFLDWIDCFLYRKNERLILLWKRSNCLCRSFLNINRMDSLTVNLFQRSTGSIKSRSIFFVIERLIRSWKDWITSIDFLKIDQIDSLTVNFFKYQWDLFAHSWSF